MKKLLTILFSAAFFIAQGQSSSTQFFKTFGGSDDEQASKVIQVPGGDYYILSTTSSYGSGNQDVHLIRTNGLGEVSWEYAYGTSGNDVATNMILTNDGGLLVTGFTDGGGNNRDNGLLLKITNTGTLSWTKYFYNDSFSTIYGAVESRFGGYYVAGSSYDDSLDMQVMVASLSTTGNSFWNKSYGGLSDDFGYAIDEDVAGRLVVAGSMANDSVNIGTTGDKDIQVIRLWTNGDISWVKNYGTLADEEAYNIRIDRTNYYITGYSDGTTLPSQSMVLLKIDSSSNIDFSHGYGTLLTDAAYDVALHGNGDFTIGGSFGQDFNAGDIALIRSNSTGAVLSYSIWGSDSIDGTGRISFENAIEGGFNVLANGRSYTSDETNDLTLIKTDDDGSTSCGSKLDFAEPGIVSMSTGVFEYSSSLSNGTPLTVTRTSITGSDSTLCCSLFARVASDSITMCTGDVISLGGQAVSGYTYSWTNASETFTSGSSNPQVSPEDNELYKLVVTSSDGSCIADSATVYVTVNARLENIDFARDTFFCEGASVTISAYPGQNSYSWQGNGYQKSGESVNFDLQDTVLLTVIDNNSCVYLDTVEILEIPIPVFSLGPDTNICENLPVTLTGPAGMADYNWNGQSSSNQTLVTATQQIHILIVTDSFGCTYQDEVLVQTRPFASFDLGPDTAFCPGGSYTIVGPGALTGYIWNDTSSSNANLTVGQPGTYHLTAFNSYLCPYSDTVVISYFDQPVFNLGNDTGFCEGTSVLLSGPSMQAGYNWSNGNDKDTNTVFAEGTVWLSVTNDDGCAYTDTIEVEEYDNPDISLGPDTTICVGESISLSPGEGYESYDWSTSAQTSSILVSDKGTYSVTVTDDNGCIGMASVDVDTVTCSKESIHYLGGSRIDIYPNPASSQLHFKAEGSLAGAELQLTDLFGKVIRTESIVSHSYTLDVSDLPQGSYQVGIRKDNNQLYFRVIVSR